MTSILGIDPGASGGIALITQDSAQVAKMPETEAEVFELLEAYAQNRPVKAYLERVAAMPKQGVSSTFRFGQNYGMLRAFLIALGIPFETVAPGMWQRSLGCLSGGNKRVTRAKAQELFPYLHCINATSDALLIAEYGRRKEL